MKQHFTLSLALIPVALLVVILGLSFCPQESYSIKVETLTVGMPPLEQNALIYVADELGLFAENGLNITVKNYDSGVSSINGLLQGEVELAAAAEFPVVRAAFQKEQITIIASSDKFENDYLIGRKDRGIEVVMDLKDKRIGVTLQTINEFYLGRFLRLNRIKVEDVEVVDIKPGHFVRAIATGEVDALIAWQPYIQQILEQEGNRVVVWPAQNSQPVYGLLACRKDWLTLHPAAVERFLKSLAEAEDYLVRHPDQAQAIVQKRLNYEDAYIASIWPKHQFSLLLDQSLILAMRDEARWMIDNQLTREKQPPDFIDYVYLDGLKAVKSEAVNIMP
ncbi:MAG: NrtA/SsuA/CpmA family ABC transporter substrate-binding protein [Anaerolineae bacterium]|nr:NrtA/SsuA/CpmA family ABC transporter substrate-binding protein [Anaerolineae bacterium]